jgi:hypothetical protein
MKDKKLNATSLRVYERDLFGELLGVMYWKRFYNLRPHFWTATYDGPIGTMLARAEGPCVIYQDGSQAFSECEQ